MTKAGEKICRTCQRPQLLEQFRKLPPLMAERQQGDGYSNDCAECRTQRRQDRKAARVAAAPEPLDQEQPEDPNRPRLSVPWTMPVDVAWDGDDFVLTQDNEGKEQTVILAPHALRRIWEWAEALALQQLQQQQAPTPRPSP